MYTEKEKIDIICEEIKKIAPEKVTGELTLETSITNEIALDSIEIMDLLIGIQEEVKKRGTNQGEINYDNMLSYLFAENDDLTIKSICNFIDKM